MAKFDNITNKEMEFYINAGLSKVEKELEKKVIIKSNMDVEKYRYINKLLLLKAEDLAKTYSIDRTYILSRALILGAGIDLMVA